MVDKPKCSKCGERDVFAKELCSRCYGVKWREDRKVERGVITGDVIEGEIVAESTALATIPSTHLTAVNPEEMKAAQSDLKAWLEQKLTVLEHDIREANAALNEARRNGWATQAFTAARNRAVDDETFYNKVLAAVEAGHTIIPDFPISVFAIRTTTKESQQTWEWNQQVDTNGMSIRNPAESDCSPVGAGAYRNPEPRIHTWTGYKRKDSEGKEYYPFFARRTGAPAGDIQFPMVAARSPVMQATAAAMADKVFDQLGVCHPLIPMAGSRRVQPSATRAGDPLIIGQILRKRVGSRQKCISFIIAWHLNLNEL